MDNHRARTLALLPNLAAIDGTSVAYDERQQAQECQPEYSCSLVKKFFSNKLFFNKNLLGKFNST